MIPDPIDDRKYLGTDRNVGSEIEQGMKVNKMNQETEKFQNEL